MTELQPSLEDQLIAILSMHVGETGHSEGAVEVLNRLLQEHKCPLDKNESVK